MVDTPVGAAHHGDLRPLPACRGQNHVIKLAVAGPYQGAGVVDDREVSPPGAKEAQVVLPGRPGVDRHVEIPFGEVALVLGHVGVRLTAEDTERGQIANFRWPRTV